MRKIYFYSMIFLSFYTLWPITLTDHIITFFIRQYPEPLEGDAQKFTSIIQKAKIPYTLLKKKCPRSNQGIIASYHGYGAISNNLGQITFPRLTQKPNFLLIITEMIKPIFMIGNTIHHWELMPTLASAFYSIEQKQDLPTKLYYWDVKPTEKPINNIIPLNAITIFAKPSAIYVPEGITITTRSPQLVLPPIYAKSSIRSIENALYYLSIKQFFTPVQLKSKKATDVYYSNHLKFQ